MEILIKSTQINFLLKLIPHPNVVLAFSISPNEIINIKGEKSITLGILKTRNGPILPQDIYGVGSIRPEGHEISINWTGLSSKDRSIESFISLMRSSTIEEATGALSLLTVPGQNILLADKESIGIFI